MNYILEVCAIALAFTTNLISPAAAQSAAQPMQEGISVRMASSKNAAPMPDADNADAWIVTLNNTGGSYFGANQVTFDGLKQEMISHPRNRNQKLYIKADERVQYADVERVLVAARDAEFLVPVLLTAQRGAQASETPVLPTGMEVAVGPSLPSRSVTVQILNSPQGQPIMKVNNEQIQWSNLPDRLKQSFQNERERSVLVKADGALPFAEVVQTIDACRSAGAKVVLATPEL